MFSKIYNFEMLPPTDIDYSSIEKKDTQNSSTKINANYDDGSESNASS